MVRRRRCGDTSAAPHRTTGAASFGKSSVSATDGESPASTATSDTHGKVFRMADYSSTPLARKLGIKPGHRVLLDGAPAGFDIGELPDGVVVRRRAGAGPYQVVVCFCGDSARLASRWAPLSALTTTNGMLWIAWPKRASGVATDLTDNVIRDYVLSHGRVDVKVCAVDEVWSGMGNVIRLVDRTR
jgi:hypothetical protein